MHVYILYIYNKKAFDVLSSGGLFPGTELIPLFPYRTAGLSKRGGDQCRYTDVNLVTGNQP